MWRAATRFLSLRSWTAEDAKTKLNEAERYVRELKSLRIQAGSGALIVDARVVTASMLESSQALLSAVRGSIVNQLKRDAKQLAKNLRLKSNELRIEGVRIRE